MSSVGIVVNPFSGKDLRRISSAAQNVSNSDKADKVIRIIKSIQYFDSIDRILLLPDNYYIGSYIASTIRKQSDFPKIDILDFEPQDNPEDTLLGVQKMLEENIKCLVVLGGDGTCRLAGKACGNVPLIPISTGTNNVYPEFWEGTTVGAAVAYVADHGVDPRYCLRSKQISVYVNHVLSDSALVDAAITTIPYIGSKVVPDVEDITDVVVCKCAPELIGLSALVGSVEVCEDTDNYGYAMHVGNSSTIALAPLNPGELTPVPYHTPKKLTFGEEWSVILSENGTIALDGERTVVFQAGDRIDFRINRDGPYKVNIKEALRCAVLDGCLQHKTNGK